MITVFILSSKCNLNCEFCICQNEKELTTEFVKNKLNHCSGKVIFTGGEALLREDINELCKFAKNKNLEVGIHTNCILFDKLNLDYVDFINVPIDGPKEIHNQLRKNNYHFVIDTLEKIKKTNIKLRISTIATKLNITKIKDISSIIDQYPIDLWRIFKYKGNNQKYKINSEEFEKLKTIKANCKIEFIEDIDNFGKWKKIADYSLVA